MPSSASHCFSPIMALKVQYQLLVTLGETFEWLGVVLGTIAVWRVLCMDSTLLIKELEGIITFQIQTKERTLRYSIQYYIRGSGVSGYQYMNAMQSLAKVTGFLPGTEYTLLQSMQLVLGSTGVREL